MYKCEFIGEAMKIKRLLLIILLVPVMILGQDINQLKNTVTVKSLELMSDEELESYWNKAQEDGYSLDQIKTIARAQGASEADLAKFEKRIKKFNLKGTKDVDDNLKKVQNELSSIFGLTPKETEESQSVLKIYLPLPSMQDTLNAIYSRS